MSTSQEIHFDTVLIIIEIETRSIQVVKTFFKFE